MGILHRDVSCGNVLIRESEESSGRTDGGWMIDWEMAHDAGEQDQRQLCVRP